MMVSLEDLLKFDKTSKATVTPSLGGGCGIGMQSSSSLVQTGGSGVPVRGNCLPPIRSGVTSDSASAETLPGVSFSKTSKRERPSSSSGMMPSDGSVSKKIKTEQFVPPRFVIKLEKGLDRSETELKKQDSLNLLTDLQFFKPKFEKPTVRVVKKPLKNPIVTAKRSKPVSGQKVATKPGLTMSIIPTNKPVISGVTNPAKTKSFIAKPVAILPIVSNL